MKTDNIKELDLLEFKLGVWELKNWDVKTCAVQLKGTQGLYCLENIQTGKILIGEGNISKRICDHTNLSRTKNIAWKKDLIKYGTDSIRLIWIITEFDEINRKTLENKLQLYFLDECYNRPKLQYPAQKELLKHIDSLNNKVNPGNISKRLHNFTKRVGNLNSECWESNCAENSSGYCSLTFNKKTYLHHILMYILYNGNFNTITHTLHHKCKNTKCVNPEHLEVCTMITNIGYKTNKQIIDAEIIRLKNDGKNIDDICQILILPRCRVIPIFKVQNSSIYHGVAYQRGSYIGRINRTFLGYYEKEEDAAKNVDYYIYKNNLLNKIQLNFHNIDYKSKFVSYLTKSGNINQNIPNRKTIFIDFDGVCVRHGGTLENILSSPAQILPGVKEKFDLWKKLDYYVVITTARPESSRDFTNQQIKNIGLWYNKLIMGITNGTRHLINDTKPYCDMYETAFATTVDRDKGLEGLQI